MAREIEPIKPAEIHAGQTKQSSSADRGVPFFQSLAADVRFTLRMMRKNVGFTAAAVLCLMLGIGATTGIFTVVNAVLLRPLPYAHPEQLMRVYTEFPPLRPPDMNDTPIEGFVPRTGGPIENVDFDQVVTKDYFATMGIRLMDGRLFDDRDGENAPPVVIVNQTMAMTFWSNESAIGKHVKPDGGSPTSPWSTVVGVVEDVKNAGLDRPAGTEVYLPVRQINGLRTPELHIVMRAQSGNPGALVGEVRQTMRDLDPSLPLANVRTMDDILETARSRPKFLTSLLALFSAVALAIATVGIYGVVSYSVARRTKEFGLRMVLGAQTDDVMALVMKQGAWMVLVGVAAGLLTALALTRFMASLLFGVAATDLATFAGVSAVLAAVTLAACWVPAHRATRVDPVSAMRCE